MATDAITRNLTELVAVAVDRLIDTAAEYGGLVPSILDRGTGAMLAELPPHVEGQRDDDRAPRGANLSHDHPLLSVMMAIGSMTGEARYGEAAARYLDTWTSKATRTPTGLFAWGEHSFWDLDSDRPGNSYVATGTRPDLPLTHDHLLKAPEWLWDEIGSRDPAAVQRFAKALDLHFKEGEPAEYTRHARINEPVRPGRGPRACDFPRHLGFYLLDWAIAYEASGDPLIRERIVTHSDYWWTRRDRNALLRIESRSPGDDPRSVRVTPPQTLSLAVSLADSARRLRTADPGLAIALDRQARGLDEGFFAVHDPSRPEGVWLAEFDTGAVHVELPLWGGRYTVWPLARVALLALARYRSTTDARMLEWASAVGRAYATQPVPRDLDMPALDSGLVLELLADLAEVTGSPEWVDAGARVASDIVELFFDESPLPRGATSADWYESQLGTAHLLHGLLRVARPGDALQPNYSAR